MCTSIRALTEPRWADEIRRMVDSLFHALQQSSKSGTTTSNSPVASDMGRPFNRLSNYFVTCGQWLPLPAESHVWSQSTRNLMTDCLTGSFPFLFFIDVCSWTWRWLWTKWKPSITKIGYDQISHSISHASPVVERKSMALVNVNGRIMSPIKDRLSAKKKRNLFRFSFFLLFSFVTGWRGNQHSAMRYNNWIGRVLSGWPFTLMWPVHSAQSY